MRRHNNYNYTYIHTYIHLCSGNGQMFKKGNLSNDSYFEMRKTFHYINLSEKGNMCKLIACVNYNIIMMNLLLLLYTTCGL